MPIKSQRLLDDPPACCLAEMQNDTLLGECIMANILTKKFNESLWGFIHKICGGVKGIIEHVDP